IKVTDPYTNRVTIYQDASAPLAEEEIATTTPRVMDCLDCHNRPSHIYRSPDSAIDQLISVGRIDRSIPSIKRVAVEAMAADYSSIHEASESIASQMSDYYRSTYPDLYSQMKLQIDAAIVATEEAYRSNIFPKMGAKWSVYPDNIGHFDHVGCMRCHDGEHIDSEGIPITRECDTCHIILSQGSEDRYEMAGAHPGLRFQHPEDIGEAWTEIGCYECHSGVQP
ncbi:MAG: cytochrome C, partial [Acidobacteriota bacterium]